MNTKNTRKGFTTVELVIVIAVIAILATVLIPTFSGMIEKANLSADTQNVRNMNMVLMTHMLDDTEHFGDVRRYLIEGGYKTGEKFLPKSAGHKYYWYVDELDRDGDGKKENISVILLVDERDANNPKVVYPQEYVTLLTKEKIENIRLCFDLNLPAVDILKNNNPTDSEGNKILITDNVSSFPYENVPLSVLYTFTASKEGEEFDGWIADYYVSVDLPDSTENKIATGGDGVILSVAGEYGEYGWIPITLKFDADLPNVPFLGSVLSGGDANLTYAEVKENVGVFNCGVVGDEVGGADQGVKLTVELRLTNKNTGEEKVFGIIKYTYK